MIRSIRAVLATQPASLALFLLLFASLFPLPSFAQVATGAPPFGSFGGGPDTINLADLNSHGQISVLHKPGRGMNFTYDLSYDTSVWYPVTSGGTTTWQPVQNWGWRGQTEVATGYLGSSSAITQTCCAYNCGNPQQITVSNWVYHDAFGVSHPFSGSAYLYPSVCNGGVNSSTGFTSQATDGSGYTLIVTGSTNTTTLTETVTARNGTIVNAPYNSSGGSASAKDSNGNMISVSTTGVFTDTVGTTAVTVVGSGTPTSPMTFTYSYLKSDGTTGSASVTINYKSYTVKTNFGISGITEYGPTSVSLVDNVTLPNGNLYSFSYEVTPGTCTPLSGTYPNNCVTARIASETLPTGGSISYAYSGGNNGIFSDGSTATLTRTVSDGTTSNTWTYARTLSNSTTTITAPQLSYDSAANVTVLTFDSNSHETSRKIYQGPATGTPLRTINNTWATNRTPATTVVILEDGLTQSETDTTYDSYGSRTLTSEYDWGSGAHGSLLRTITTSYTTGTPHQATQMIVSDGAGVRKSRTDITYDGTSLTCVTGAAQHDDANYGCSFTARGNPTTVTTYTDAATPSGALTKNSYFDSLGNLGQADLDCCQKKAWSYSSITQYAWPDSETSGATGGPQTTTSKTYNLTIGLVVTSTDANNKVKTYTYDNLLRQTNVARADGSNLGYSYDDAANTSTVNYPIDGTNQRRVKTYSDGLGRVTKRTTFDLSGTSYSIVETKYDAVGRGYKVSNPHNSTAQYWTETRYDALGRNVKTILQDGGQSTVIYALNAVTTTDPTGKQRKSQSNALGRVTAVFEPDIANNNSLTQQTSYAYNVMDSLASTTQGSLTRTYNYDGLNRLTSEVAPESGTVSYQYNSFSLKIQRADTRGVITTYSYDTLNRPTGISYNVGSTGVPATAGVTYTYGTSGTLNNNGRLLTMTDGVGSETYSYDVMGRVTQLQKTISGTNYTSSYTYNQDSSVTSETYPSNRVIQTSYDVIGRPTSIANGSTNYVSSETYNPAQQTTGFTYGNSVAASFGFSADRMLRQTISYSKGAQTLFSLTYGYTQNGGNNGQITTITDAVDSGRSASYTYDALARLSQAVTTGSVGYPQWGLSFAYDRFGSRTNQSSVYDGPPTNSVGMAPNSNLIITPVPPSYEARGNMTNDASNALAYDAENRLVTNTGGSATNYSIDGNNLRVKKASDSSSTVYFSSNGKVVAEYDNGAAPASPSREYIYSGGALLATISGATTYHLRDHLSIRVNTDSSGNVIGQQGHYPFGESWYATATTSKWQFTSYERDSESGNDYAMDRVYVNRLGRFSAVDPVMGNTDNPQSLNRYAYVVDDPIDFTDPTGDDWLSDMSDPAKAGPNYSGNPDLASITGTRGNGGNFTATPPFGVSQPPETPDFYDWSFYPVSEGEPGGSGSDSDTLIGEANCDCTSTNPKPRAVPFWRVCDYNCQCDNPKDPYYHTPHLPIRLKRLQEQHKKQYNSSCSTCPTEAKGIFLYSLSEHTPIPGVSVWVTFYAVQDLTYVSKTQ